MIRQKRNFVLTAIFLIMFQTMCASMFCQNQSKSRTVKVACGINNALYITEDGRVTGYCAELLTSLAKLNNWKLEYIAGTWNASVEALESGKIDLLFPTQKIPGREKTMGFSALIGGYQPISLYAKKGADIIYNDFNKYNGSKIAVSEGSSNALALADFAKKNGFSYTPVYMDTTSEKEIAVLNGTVDFMVASTSYDFTSLMITSVISYETFYYTTNINDKELLEELDNGMKQIMIQRPEVFTNVYSAFLGSGMLVAQTKEEFDWIAKNKTIVVGVYQDSPPLYHEISGKNGHGIYADLIELLRKKSGLNIEVYPINRTQYAYDLLENGKIDLLLGSNSILLSDGGKSEYYITAPLMNYVTVNVSKYSYELAEDSNPVFVLTSGRKYWENFIRKRYPNVEIIYCESAKDCLIAVQNGKADITLLNAYEFNFQSKNSRFNNLIEWEGDRIEGNVVMTAMPDADKTMLSILDKVIMQLDIRDVTEITTQSLNKAYDDYTLLDYLYIYKMGIIVAVIFFILIFIIFLTNSITRKSYINQLETNNDQLEKANNQKNLFLSRMSHELRTPLNAISGYSHLLKDFYVKNPKEHETEIEHINGILVSQKYLLQIIDGILDTKQIESGNITLDIDIYDSEEVINKVLEIIRLDVDEKNIKLNVNRITQTCKYFRCDGIKIGQILLSLLSNAVKFTPKYGKISFSFKAIKKIGNAVTIQFVVQDNGIGMSKEFVETKLFTIFTQEYEGIDSPYAGTGIGLTYARMLAQKMGGDIVCESEKGKGSTFTATIVIEAVPNEEGEIKYKKEATRNANAQSINVLVCEDNVINQSILKKILEKNNYHVTLASNGKEGLDIIKNSAPNEYQIILMDIRMPIMDGYEATRAIRLLERNDAKHIPILAVSANAYEEDIQKSLKSGMNAHLVKPIEPQIIYKAINDFVAKSDL